MQGGNTVKTRKKEENRLPRILNFRLIHDKNLKQKNKNKIHKIDNFILFPYTVVY